jgi:putative flippase GtrA
MQLFDTFMSKCLGKQNLDKQVVRYIIVGVVSNTIGYLLYLALTQLGVGHKTAMSGLYFIGVGMNFYLNRSWTFRTTQSVRFGPSVAGYSAEVPSESGSAICIFRSGRLAS